jgi:MFS family permease
MNPPDRDVERRAVPLLLLLAGVSGLVDAASYLRLGHVFVANMTGNVIFVGFALAGATGLSLASSAAAIGSFLAGIATTFIAIALVDRIGRKPLLFAGSAGMVITLGVLAFLFGTAPLVSGQPHLGAVTGPIALVAANLYVVAFGFSWGPVVWVLLGEMFPNRIRAIAVSVAAAAQWLANFAVSTSFPPLQHLGLGFAYGLYTAAALLSIVFVWFFMQETKGKNWRRCEASLLSPWPDLISDGRATGVRWRSAGRRHEP